FRPLLFATGKTFVDRARCERAVHSQQLHLLVKLRVVIGRFEFFAFRQTRRERGPQKIGDGDSWNFAWVLESEKKSLPSAFVGLHSKNIFPIHSDFAP